MDRTGQSNLSATSPAKPTKVETMLDYADMYKLHTAEMPRSLDEQTHVVKKYGNTVIWCEPTQIIRRGDWVGVWRVTRLWLSDRLLGYVRFDLNEQFAYMRPGLWDNEEMITRWDISQNGGFVTGLRNACETLLLYRMTDLT